MEGWRFNCRSRRYEDGSKRVELCEEASRAKEFRWPPEAKNGKILPENGFSSEASRRNTALPTPCF